MQERKIIQMTLLLWEISTGMFHIHGNGRFDLDDADADADADADSDCVRKVCTGLQMHLGKGNRGSFLFVRLDSILVPIAKEPQTVNRVIAGSLMNRESQRWYATPGHRLPHAQQKKSQLQGQIHGTG
jgi:hypothetical protein